MAVLPDVLACGLDIVFCGTAAGRESARRKAYYAGPGNRFWVTLCRVGLTPRELAPEEYAGVVSFGLGLTDLAKTMVGTDRELVACDFDIEEFARKIREVSPRIVAFTSKRAAQSFLGRKVHYGVLPEKIGNTVLFVLPSPSGAARRYWDEGPWQQLAGICKRRTPNSPPNLAFERDAAKSARRASS